MQVIPNANVLTQQTLDSGSLGVLTRVVHQFSKVGAFVGTVYQADQSRAYFHLTVDATNTQAQVNVDLASLVPGPQYVPCTNCAPGSSERQFTVGPTTKVLFFVSSGAGGLAVSVADAQEAVVFDSRKLQVGDYFVASILRPGQYRATNTVNQQRHDTKVAYPPATTAKGYVPPPPHVLKAIDTGFSEASVQLSALQTKIYDIQTASRLQIELVTADDGPHGAH